jgi:hypothetical protein
MKKLKPLFIDSQDLAHAERSVSVACSHAAIEGLKADHNNLNIAAVGVQPVRMRFFHRLSCDRRMSIETIVSAIKAQSLPAQYGHLPSYNKAYRYTREPSSIPSVIDDTRRADHVSRAIAPYRSLYAVELIKIPANPGVFLIHHHNDAQRRYNPRGARLYGRKSL